MYKIGIVGSGPERFGDFTVVRRSICNAIEQVGFQYNENSVVFGVESRIGVGLWTGDECINRDYRYHLFLPYSLEETYEHWYTDQKEMLKSQFSRAYSLTMCNQDDTYKPLVDSSNFIIAFWAGNKSGHTRDAIKYAFEHNKIVLDGFNDLRLMTNRDIRKTRKTWKKE